VELAVVIAVAALVFSVPRSSGACPPVVWETERVSLSLGSVTVDGADQPLPPDAGTLDVRLGPFSGGPSHLHLDVRRDSVQIYLGAFR